MHRYEHTCELIGHVDVGHTIGSAISGMTRAMCALSEAIETAANCSDGEPINEEEREVNDKLLHAAQDVIGFWKQHDEALFSEHG